MNPMTLPQNVADAVKSVRKHFDLSMDDATCEAWQTIRAHLMGQEAEIARLESAWHVETLNEKDRLIALQEADNDRVKSRLAAAHALLRSEAALLRAWARESREGGWSTHQYDPMLRRANELDAHLQGAGDEA